MKLTILGATGSIGRSTADVVTGQRETIRVEAVVGGSDAAALAAVARRLDARFAALADERKAGELKDLLAGTGIACGAGEGAVIEAVDRDCDTVLAAISGVAGLRPTHRAMVPGRCIALANKESLVCAGEAFMNDARRIGVEIVPVDSEHNALAQALQSGQRDDVTTAVITASGGPFRTWSAERIAAATPEQAAAHPVWSMGMKINIDSASLMNKGLELIEAHHLFGLEADRLDVLVHPQSIIHALVRWRDGAWTAEMALPDMKVPIANALATERRFATDFPKLDLTALATLTFEAVDENRFPCLTLAKQALQAGGAATTVLNAANEIAVAAFLQRRIGFPDIAKLVARVCDSFAGHRLSPPSSVEEALQIDAEARRVAETAIGAVATS